MSYKKNSNPSQILLEILTKDSDISEGYDLKDIESMPIDVVKKRLTEIGFDSSISLVFDETFGVASDPSRHLLSMLIDDEKNERLDIANCPLSDVITDLDQIGIDHVTGMRNIEELLIQNSSRVQQTHFTPRVIVIGVGGGGTNAVDNMIALNLQGVDFVVANTDAQQLMHSRADRRVQLGPRLTQGLGAGAKPEIGCAAAEEVADELIRHLDAAHMVFIAAGMGGGTGTGAAPVIARLARERGVLTVGVVTKPFTFEGARRGKVAEAGIAELQQFVDTLIVIPNQNLFRLANERTSWKEAFKMADHVLYMGVRGVTDLMVAPGLVNLDFADIRTVMAEMGKAMMGTGEAEGENRAIRAAEAAISNPLLEDASMGEARGLLINITGGDDMTLFEVDQAANRIREEVAEDVNIIFGSAIDEDLSGRMRVSVVATGIKTSTQRAGMEQHRSRAVEALGNKGAENPIGPGRQLGKKKIYVL